MTALAGSLGVEGIFMFTSSPLSSLRATKSVNVPPISMLTRYFTNCHQTTQNLHTFTYLRIPFKARASRFRLFILTSYYKQLFTKYPWLKPAIPKPGKMSKRSPLSIIRPKTLRILCALARKMKSEGIIIEKTDLAILMQLITNWTGCSRRKALDYAYTLMIVS